MPSGLGFTINSLNKEKAMTTTMMSQLFGKDFDKFFIGFDDQINQMMKFHDEVTKNIPNYPPFNIKKVDENHYAIEMAIAGFGQTDIDIELNDGKLVVRGNVDCDETPDDFIFKGIAQRAFTRTFALNDEIEVKDAEILNGMLKIGLERLIPEHKQPKKIPVKAKSAKQMLTENA
jgi:molecular chaperone IbpA